MKKNVASQKIGAQMITAADGTAFTGSVTVEVTIDAGTQATGSVGSGACTHEGNGYHTYAPAQAETNGDLVAFTFHGTGAVPVTVQVFTGFPQTGDSFGLIGATGSGLTSLATQASVNTIDDLLDTEVAAIKTVVDAVQAKTDNLPTDPADASVVAGLIATLQTDVDTIVAAIDPTGATDIDDLLALLALLASRAEPGTGVPPATASLMEKVDYLYKVVRNKKAQDADEFRLFNDDGTTVGQKSTVSSDGTTTTVGELGTGA